MSEVPQDKKSIAAPAARKVEIRPSEERLFSVAHSFPGKKVVVISCGRAQIASLLAQGRNEIKVSAWFLDQHHAGLAREELSNTNAEVVCSADWPIEHEVDLVAISLHKGGESELARDFLQNGYQNLREGGILAVGIDNPKDKWLLGQMQGFDKSVKVRPFKDAVVYYVIKRKPLKKLKDFSCTVAFRDEGNLIQIITRPGVFAHRQFDNGARQILDSVEVFPECSIIEIGCGSGAMSLALAKRDPSANLFAIDSHARAVDCLQKGAQLNGLSNITAEVNHDGELRERTGTFDMALANPPYYSDFKIARHFVETSQRALRHGGRMVLVTRKPQWYRDNLATWFTDCEVFQSRRYHIATGVKQE